MAWNAQNRADIASDLRPGARHRAAGGGHAEHHRAEVTQDISAEVP